MEKTRFFRLVLAGRRCAAASRLIFSKIRRFKRIASPPEEIHLAGTTRLGGGDGRIFCLAGGGVGGYAMGMPQEYRHADILRHVVCF